MVIIDVGLHCPHVYNLFLTHGKHVFSVRNLMIKLLGSSCPDRIGESSLKLSVPRCIAISKYKGKRFGFYSFKHLYHFMCSFEQGTLSPILSDGALSFLSSFLHALKNKNENKSGSVIGSLDSYSICS